MPTEADTLPSTGSTISEAANVFESLLTGAETADTKDPKEGADAEPTEQVEQSADPEAQDADPALEEGNADDAPEPEAEAPKPLTTTVKIDGKEVELPIEEVAKGYQRQADYSRKTAELAEARKAHDAETAKVSEERAQYAQLLTALRSQIESEGEPDWQAIYAENPLNYVIARDQWRDKQERKAAASAELDRVTTLQAAQRTDAQRRAVAEGRDKLFATNPEWKDAKKWETARAAILTYAKDIGYTDAELSNANDPRAIVALNKARLYDAFMAKKPQGTPVQRPAATKAGASEAVSTRTVTEVTKAKQRLAQTGRVRDAASVFENFL